MAINAIPLALGPFFNPEYSGRAGAWLLVGNALFAVALPFAVGLALIYFPKTIATQALRVEGIEPTSATQATLLERVAVSTLGLWLTVQSVLDAAHLFSKWKLYQRLVDSQFPGANEPLIGPNEFAGYITAALQLGLGLWLLLGARGLANAFARLRGQETEQ